MTRKKQDREEKKNPENEMIESEIWIDITYDCPVRGKVVQKVKGIRYKSQKIPDKQINYEYEFLKEENDDSEQAESL